jgi:hypothetical protein
VAVLQHGPSARLLKSSRYLHRTLVKVAAARQKIVSQTRAAPGRGRLPEAAACICNLRRKFFNRPLLQMRIIERLSMEIFRVAQQSGRIPCNASQFFYDFLTALWQTMRRRAQAEA